MTEHAEAATTTGANCEAVLDEIQRVVVGRRPALTLILTAVLARGHVLIEDLPGLGKTLIARSFAAALGLDFTRVQFTPDLLPADLLGSTIYDMQSGRFEFRHGPIFTNLLLADEINRTPPKTQAALLEAMAERQVSIDGVTHRLQAPFVVLATDNPIEYEGTYPLPEAQLDRFMIRLELRYLSDAEELSMLRRRIDRGSPEPEVHQVIDAHDLLAMRESVEQVTVHDDVLRYVVSLAAASRQHPQIAVGASPRAELDIVAAGPRPRAAARPRLRHPRGRQGTGGTGDGPPDQSSSRDVGPAGAQLGRGGRPAAPGAGAENPRRDVIDVAIDSGRIALAGIAVGPGPGDLRGRCAGVRGARLARGSWSRSPRRCSAFWRRMRWQRPPPEVHVHAEPDVLRCFEAERVRLVVWGTADDGSTVELTVVDRPTAWRSTCRPTAPVAS